MRSLVLLLILTILGLDVHAQSDTLRRDSLTARPPLAPPDSLKTTYTEQGIASWYGQAFAGRKTSSGEIFCPDSMTCAHKTLPFGTLLRVTNLKNDSVVIVKVTDRLPKSSKRCIDLTSGAAKRLNFLRAGLTTVKLEAIGTAPINKPKRPAPKPVVDTTQKR